MEYSRTNIIVSCLPQDISEIELKLLFNKCGDFENCHIVQDKETGGFGFINFIDENSASKSHELNGHHIGMPSHLPRPKEFKPPRS